VTRGCALSLRLGIRSPPLQKLRPASSSCAAAPVLVSRTGSQARASAATARQAALDCTMQSANSASRDAIGFPDAAAASAQYSRKLFPEASASAASSSASSSVPAILFAASAIAVKTCLSVGRGPQAPPEQQAGVFCRVLCMVAKDTARARAFFYGTRHNSEFGIPT
jgi:type II secretory pathway pseudopilin PulG